MSKLSLNEREFELVNILGSELGSNQRDLSHHMNLSLGMVNMLIRRLISKGYIRIEQLNKRKVQYILTPKGFAEKMRKSVNYTLKTIDSIGLIKGRVKEIILELYKKGNRRFYIYSESDLTILIESAFCEAHLSDCVISIIKEMPDSELDGVLLIGKENVNGSKINRANRVNLIAEISKKNNFVNMFKNGGV